MYITYQLAIRVADMICHADLPSLTLRLVVMSCVTRIQAWLGWASNDSDEPECGWNMVLHSEFKLHHVVKMSPMAKSWSYCLQTAANTGSVQYVTRI